MAVCAEAVAIGRAITEAGDQGIETIVAVRHPKPDEPDQTIAVVSPCGSCREIICDYDSNARVIVPNGDDPVVAPITELLPNKYIRGPGRW
jgi:cytidine deaminase